MCNLIIIISNSTLKLLMPIKKTKKKKLVPISNLVLYKCNKWKIVRFLNIFTIKIYKNTVQKRRTNSWQMPRLVAR